ncbi:MAG TPA: STAS domain-containing protein [Solirubrobacteraceae bacterium]|nr:STAS domain-containing protein [Solirubrobacteraceae bacterium]
MGVSDQLRIDLSREPERIVLSLAGELDMASAELLAQAVDREDARGAPLLVLDLQQLQFIDSTGLRSILTALERCREREQEFAITPGSQQVQRLLRITGVAEHLPTIPPTGEMVA